MKTSLFTRIPGMAVAGLLPLVVVGGLGLGAAANAEAGPTFEGAWLNDVKIVTCPPAPHAVIATFQSMTTYMHGGVLMEGGGPATPAVSRSAGQGIWERAGHRTFRAFFRSHFFDNLGRLVRIVEVTSHPSLIKGDNPETLMLSSRTISVDRGRTKSRTSILSMAR
jgi:hypothetical protein